MALTCINCINTVSFSSNPYLTRQEVSPSIEDYLRIKEKNKRNLQFGNSVDTIPFIGKLEITVKFTHSENKIRCGGTDMETVVWVLSTAVPRPFSITSLHIIQLRGGQTSQDPGTWMGKILYL